jgi:peptidoglycan/LPS O-acetylase OafA/YrhL
MQANPDHDPRNRDATVVGAVRSLTHEPGLDAVRAVAVLMVVTTHLFLFFVFSKEFVWLAGGFLGVEIFFVLSGFLITALLLGEHDRSGRISFRGFYRRRALRLLPALVVMLFAYLVYSIITHQDMGVEVKSLLASLFYIVNWLEVRNQAVTNSHLWSLAVEEQFYAVWPLITAALLASALTRRHAIKIIFAAIVGLTIWTMVLWRPGTGFILIGRIYNRTDVQGVPLLVGALAAYLWTGRMVPVRLVRFLAIPSIVLIGLCAWNFDVTTGFYWDGGLALISVAAAIVILAVVDGHWSALAWAPITAVGRVSYGLYLWHIPVFYAVAHSGDRLATSVQIPLALLITAGVTTASWYFVEVPFLRMKYRSRAGAPVPAVV